jgi:hypothetical protein
MPVSCRDDRVVQRPDKSPLHVIKIGLIGVIEVRHVARYSKLENDFAALANSLLGL